MRIATRLALVVAIALLCGCGSILPRSDGERTFYYISASTASCPVVSPLSLDLVVRSTRASGFLDGRRIVFSTQAATRGYYQLARWVEPPTERVTNLLLGRLDSCNVFAGVSRSDSALHGDVELHTSLVDFRHDAAEDPGVAVVELVAEVIDLNTRKLIARKRFQKTVPVTTYNADGAVAALTEATTALVDSVIVWTADAVATSKNQALNQ